MEPYRGRAGISARAAARGCPELRTAENALSAALAELQPGSVALVSWRGGAAGGGIHLGDVFQCHRWFLRPVHGSVFRAAGGAVREAGRLAGWSAGAGCRTGSPDRATGRAPGCRCCLGVGPAGAYVTQLDQARREVLRNRCAQLLPPAPFQVTVSAWCVRARA